MLNVRYGLFETNSSSVHAIVIMNKKHSALLEETNGSTPEYFVHLEFNKETITPEDIKVIDIDSMKRLVKENNSDANVDDFYFLKNEANCLDYYTIDDLDCRAEFDDYSVFDFEFYA